MRNTIKPSDGKCPSCFYDYPPTLLKTNSMPPEPGQPHSQAPAGRLAGIDYGTVRIGIAITDREQRFASPLANYTRRNAALDADYFRALVAREQIAAFIVGLPLHLDGRESQKSTE